MERAQLDLVLDQIIDILADSPYVSDEDIGYALGLSADEVAELIEDYGLEGLAEEQAELRRDSEIDESMDGDFDSAMASAGFGTDEDYGYIAENDYFD